MFVPNSHLKYISGTIKIQKNQTAENTAIIILKSEQGGFYIPECVQKMQTELQTV